jgi:pilus assembly protein CpaE
MARLIAVSIDCRNEAARQTFEEIISRRRDYLVVKGQGTGAADMLLLELSDARPQQTFEHMRGLLAVSPHLEIFLTSSRTDPQVMLEAFRLGVKEFLPQPLTRQDIEPALARFEERFTGRVSEVQGKSGKVISILGARGAVGASTVAANLAVILQKPLQGESVSLVDLDMHGGDLGLFFDLHPSQGFKHLSNDISRLDETIVRSSLLKHSSGIQLLASGCESVEESEPTTGSAMRIIGLLRSIHRHVVMDCGHVVTSAVKEALDCSDHIILVTTLSLPTIRRTKRLLEMLGVARNPADRVLVIANRYTNEQKELFVETENMLGLRIAGRIPDDYKTASEALNQGQPLTVLAPRTTIGQWYLRSMDQIMSDSPAGARAGAGKDQKNISSFLGRYLPGLGFEAKGKPSTI